MREIFTSAVSSVLRELFHVSHEPRPQRFRDNLTITELASNLPLSAIFLETLSILEYNIATATVSQAFAESVSRLREGSGDRFLDQPALHRSGRGCT